MLGCLIESVLGSLFGGATEQKHDVERKVRRIMVVIVILFLMGLVLLAN